jgi:hypothetical protein
VSPEQPDPKGNALVIVIRVVMILFFRVVINYNFGGKGKKLPYF